MKIICDWDNCNEIGAYKAPVEKDNSKKYRLLCLNHIKIFNKNWNYFENMNDLEIIDFIKADMTWHKPTQNFSAQDNFFKILWCDSKLPCSSNTPIFITSPAPVIFHPQGFLTCLNLS